MVSDLTSPTDDATGPHAPHKSQAAASVPVAEAAIPPDVAALSFEAAMTEFQSTVAALETGGQPLEEALALFERGVSLQRHLDRLLGDAELRFRRLVERGGGRLDAVEVPEESG